MFIVRFLLKVLTLPIRLILKLIICVGTCIVGISAGIFEFLAGIIFWYQFLSG